MSGVCEKGAPQQWRKRRRGDARGGRRKEAGVHTHTEQRTRNTKRTRHSRGGGEDR